MGLAFIWRSTGKILRWAVEKSEMPIESKGDTAAQNYLKNPSNPGQLRGASCIYISITRGNFRRYRTFQAVKFSPPVLQNLQAHPAGSSIESPGYPSSNASEAGPLESGPLAFPVKMPSPSL
jgi:hypothetical protein